MQFLLDPSRVSLGPASLLFLVVLCVVLPVAALRQHRDMQQHTLLVTRTRIYVSAMVTQVGLLVLVWLVTREQGFALLSQYRPSAMHLAIGVASLALGLLPILERFRPNAPAAHERTRLIAPRSPREFAAFYLLAITAGVTEELAYRGVLFILIASIVESWWLAAVAGAAIFGIVHLFQGWKSAGIVALIGLRDQIVVGLTGTLFIAIAVHMLHDAIAGTVIGIRARREEEATFAVS